MLQERIAPPYLRGPDKLPIGNEDLAAKRDREAGGRTACPERSEGAGRPDGRRTCKLGVHSQRSQRSSQPSVNLAVCFPK